MAKQVGIISRIRHFLPRNVLVKYYNCYIKPILQYGVLIYGCTTVNKLNRLILQQKKILRLIHFKPWTSTSAELFWQDKILTVAELHVYELVKFIFRSFRHEHSNNFSNELFDTSANVFSHETRGRAQGLLRRPRCRTRFVQHSLVSRGILTINTLRDWNIFPPNIRYPKTPHYF